MIQSRKVVAAALIVGLALIVAGLLVAPFNAPASAAATVGSDIAADRIGVAFADLPESTAHPAIKSAAVRASKGDRLAPSCAGAVWPNVDASCLSTSGGEPAKNVRMVTIGYQSDDSTTVIVRLPAGEFASR